MVEKRGILGRVVAGSREKTEKQYKGIGSIASRGMISTGSSNMEEESSQVLPKA